MIGMSLRMSLVDKKMNCVSIVFNLQTHMSYEKERYYDYEGSYVQITFQSLKLHVFHMLLIIIIF